ncbi:MAG: glycosyltransferase family 4 protein [Actinomycetota bacterium]|nr:glycosyltransferase family 4 protein [Actinomycetota bacterium]
MRRPAERGTDGPPGLLFVARRPPFPLANGARIRAHRLLTGLAERFDTTFLTFEEDARLSEGPAGRDELAALLPNVRVLTAPGPRLPKRVGQARSLASPRSWEFGRYASSHFADTMRRVVHEERISIVHLDDLGVAQLGPVAGVVNAYSAHNVEQRVLAGTAMDAHGVRRRFAAVEARKVGRDERRVWRSMTLCLAVSELDAVEMRAAGARVELCPNGADPVERLAPRRPRPGEPLRMLFVGSVDYQPNHRGLLWFLEEVLPLVRAAAPATLDVVGSQHRPLPQVEGVAYHGRVPSVRPFYELAHVAIVPVVYGSGTRLKVLEAMALGRPVVSTTVGAEGLPVEDRLHYLAGDDPAAFARSLLDLTGGLARGDAWVERMVSGAREAVAPFFWPRILARLAGVYHAEIARVARGSSAAANR